MCSNMGGKVGATTGADVKIQSFSVSKSNDTAQKLNNASSLTLSKSTITMKNDGGKTIGMIRGLTRLSDSSPRDKMTYAQQRIPPVDGIDQSHIYLDGKQVYILNNISNVKNLQTQQSKVSSKQFADVFNGDIQRLKKRNEQLKAAENAGAIIINYQ